MRFALINPPWSFEGSIYFGCPEPHLPLEFGYAKNLLQAAGHDVLLADGQLNRYSYEDIYRQVKTFGPDFTVVTTAPSYLFWRCAPPEIGVPQRMIDKLRPIAGTVCVIGPHGSTTPRATLLKSGADVLVMGEPEEILPRLTEGWGGVPSIAYFSEQSFKLQGGTHASDMTRLEPILWPSDYVARHSHHHHRFDASPACPGAEVEASRGCPYACTFCAKENFRNKYRRRNLSFVLAEIDHLIEQGVEYIYFIDEIFLPWRELLEALAGRKIKIGIQTRIDLWNDEALHLLSAAHCVSIEAGVESISEAGRADLDKKCRLTTEQLSDRLIAAKKLIPFVQGNLIQGGFDDEQSVEAWRQHLIANGIWANQPVPLFPYPGSPEYTRRWGVPDDLAWERAHDYYVGDFSKFSDIQSAEPLTLTQLELPGRGQ